jgi:hypothetical protein
MPYRIVRPSGYNIIEKCPANDPGRVHELDHKIPATMVACHFISDSQVIDIVNQISKNNYELNRYVKWDDHIKDMFR